LANLIIGLNSKLGGGKDTFADYAVEKFGYTKLYFASVLKNEVKEFLLKYNIPFEDRNIWGSQSDKEEQLFIDECYFNDIVTDIPLFIHFFNTCNKYDGDYISTFRYLLQWWGTEYRRNNFGDNYWVDKLVEETKKYDKVIISDLRFPNEYNAIINNNGICIKVIRNSSFKSNTALHISETALDHIDDWYAILENTSTLEEYYAMCDNILKDIDEKFLLDNWRI
jgi:hypothetical protein